VPRASILWWRCEQRPDDSLDTHIDDSPCVDDFEWRDASGTVEPITSPLTLIETPDEIAPCDWDGDGLTLIYERGDRPTLHLDADDA
jgi:hypothetical protein